MDKKPLPKKLSEELFMKLNYVNCRFMKSKRAYRTNYNPSNVFFTAKIIDGDETTKHKPLLHIHLRTTATDRWFHDNEDLDIDFYIPSSEFKDLIRIMDKYINDKSEKKCELKEWIK